MIKSKSSFLTNFTLASVLNILLIAVCACGLAYYLTSANQAASAEYKVTSLRTKISRLNEEQAVLMFSKSITEDPDKALQYAHEQNMTEAKDIVYVFENNNVALHR